VIVNADPRYAYEQLLPTQSRGAARLARLEPSYSGFILLLGIDRTYPQLAHHNIFFADDYPGEFAAIVDKRVPAPDPTVYVCATSISDPQHAPPGHTNLFVLVNAPATSARVDWDREATGYRDTVVRKLERMGALQCAWRRNLRPGLESPVYRVSAPTAARTRSPPALLRWRRHPPRRRHPAGAALGPCGGPARAGQ
jgi:phytoene dehydrogenase-like protein